MRCADTEKMADARNASATSGRQDTGRVTKASRCREGSSGRVSAITPTTCLMRIYATRATDREERSYELSLLLASTHTIPGTLRAVLPGAGARKNEQLPGRVCGWFPYTDEPQLYQEARFVFCCDRSVSMRYPCADTRCTGWVDKPGKYCDKCERQQRKSEKEISRERWQRHNKKERK